MDKVACRTPEGGPKGTNIPRWKFDAVRAALMACLTDGPRRVAELKDAVGEALSAEDRTNLGSLGWHVTTIRLELEVRGELVRRPGSPLQIALKDTP
ncbi:MAG: hypothetical protein AAFQ33_01240 [Pseudomonadota bacterium]